MTDFSPILNTYDQPIDRLVDHCFFPYLISRKSVLVSSPSLFLSSDETSVSVNGWIIRIKIRGSVHTRRSDGTAEDRGEGKGWKIIRDVPETTENINQVKFADSPGIYTDSVYARAREREREKQREKRLGIFRLSISRPPSFRATLFLPVSRTAALNVPCRRIFALSLSSRNIPLFRRIKA